MIPHRATRTSWYVNVLSNSNIDDLPSFFPMKLLFFFSKFCARVPARSLSRTPRCLEPVSCSFSVPLLAVTIGCPLSAFIEARWTRPSRGFCSRHNSSYIWEGPGAWTCTVVGKPRTFILNDCLLTCALLWWMKLDLGHTGVSPRCRVYPRN